VILDEPLEEDIIVDLELLLTQDGIEDPDEDPFMAKASVIWAAPTPSGQAMMGLRFVKLPPVEAQRLARFLNAVANASA
jgi:hypothetical protein